MALRAVLLSECVFLCNCAAERKENSADLVIILLFDKISLNKLTFIVQYCAVAEELPPGSLLLNPIITLFLFALSFS